MFETPRHFMVAFNNNDYNYNINNDYNYNINDDDNYYSYYHYFYYYHCYYHHDDGCENDGVDYDIRDDRRPNSIMNEILTLAINYNVLYICFSFFTRVKILILRFGLRD